MNSLMLRCSENVRTWTPIIDELSGKTQMVFGVAGVKVGWAIKKAEGHAAFRLFDWCVRELAAQASCFMIASETSPMEGRPSTEITLVLPPKPLK